MAQPTQSDDDEANSNRTTLADHGGAGQTSLSGFGLDDETDADEEDDTDA